MQATTRVLVPSDTFLSLLWVATTKTTLFREFSPHKCGHGVWWDALNVVAATISPITSGLTPSLKLFLYSVAPSLVMCHWRGHGPPLRPYHPSVWTPQNCIGLLGLGYNMWHYYFIKFLYPPPHTHTHTHIYIYIYKLLIEIKLYSILNSPLKSCDN